MMDQDLNWYAVLQSDSTARQISQMYACRYYDLACSHASLAIVSRNGYTTFYDAKKKEWQNFGGGVIGSVNSIATQFWWPKSSSVSQKDSILLVIFCMLPAFLSLFL